MRKEEERELAALEYAGQPCLPEPADENTPLWIYAIAKVRMNNLSRGYAIIKNDFTKFPYTIKIFGDGAISSFESTHPYKFLDSKYIPAVKGGKEAEAFVKKACGIGENIKMKKEDVMRGLYLYAMASQLKDEQNKKMRNDLRETEQS